MKTKIMNLAKMLVMVNVMVFGFFVIYAVIWVSLGLPVTSWSAVILVVLDVLSILGFFCWAGKGVKDEDEDADPVENIAYVCDKKACDNCGSNSFGECYYTTDIRHAKNFVELPGGKFIENPVIPKLPMINIHEDGLQGVRIPDDWLDIFENKEETT